MGEKEKNNFVGFDDSEFEKDLEDLRNHTGRFAETDVKPNESLWDYIKRKEQEESANK